MAIQTAEELVQDYIAWIEATPSYREHLLDDALLWASGAGVEPTITPDLETDEQTLTTLATSATFDMTGGRSWLNTTWSITGRSGTIVLRLSGVLADYAVPIEADISVTTDTGGFFYGGKAGQWQELRLTLVSGTLTSIQIDSVTG